VCITKSLLRVISCCLERIGGKCPHCSLQCLRDFSGQQKHHWLWGRRVTVSETGRVEPHDLPLSGCSANPVSPEVLQCADDIICND